VSSFQRCSRGVLYTFFLLSSTFSNITDNIVGFRKSKAKDVWYFCASQSMHSPKSFSVKDIGKRDIDPALRRTNAAQSIVTLTKFS